MEDDLWWKTILLEDNLKLKMIFDGREHLRKTHLCDVFFLLSSPPPKKYISKQTVRLTGRRTGTYKGRQHANYATYDLQKNMLQCTICYILFARCNLQYTICNMQIVIMHFWYCNLSKWNLKDTICKSLSSRGNL